MPAFRHSLFPVQKIPQGTDEDRKKAERYSIFLHVKLTIGGFKMNKNKFNIVSLIISSALMTALVAEIKTLPMDFLKDMSNSPYEYVAVNYPARPAKAESYEASCCTARVEGPPSYTGQTHALYLLLRRVLIVLLIPDAVHDSRPLLLMTHSAFFRWKTYFQTSTDHTYARYSATRSHPH